jgi:hypothetical protein
LIFIFSIEYVIWGAVQETAAELMNAVVIKAVLAQFFPPATLNGQPIEIWASIPNVLRLR